MLKHHADCVKNLLSSLKRHLCSVLSSGNTLGRLQNFSSTNTRGTDALRCGGCEAVCARVTRVRGEPDRSCPQGSKGPSHSKEGNDEMGGNACIYCKNQNCNETPWC